eukprot:2207291-Amphidinium_carterae.1
MCLRLNMVNPGVMQLISACSAVVGDDDAVADWPGMGPKGEITHEDHIPTTEGTCSILESYRVGGKIASGVIGNSSRALKKYMQQQQQQQKQQTTQNPDTR